MKTAEVISKIGSRNAVAALLGITGSAVTQWGDTVPLLRQYQLAAARPDLFPLPETWPAQADH
jgi:DNA-binding transcriptional regulator YdaS (Cro superfamily)